MNDIQTLVDALAAELNRPTGVDDRHFRSVAYSSHPEGVDSVRLASILQREAPRPVREWLEELGVGDAETYLRVPANPALEMAARVCLPLRFDRILLGFLWLIDEPTSLAEEQVEVARGYAEECAVALYRTKLMERDDRRHESELLAGALGLGERDATAAGEELLRAGHLVHASAYAVLVLSACRAEGEVPSDGIRVRLVDAAEHLRRAVAPHHLVVAVDGVEIIALVAVGSSGEATRRAEALAAQVQTGSTAGWRPLVGVSEETGALGDLGRAYRQARAAAWVAAQIGRGEAVVRWANLGAYRTVAGLLGDRDPASLTPASLDRLLASPDALPLIETLELYLDLAGDARAAAERLFIHRSSLYGRLHRIQEIAGVDLRSGDDRLELHLGIRLWRLAASSGTA